VIFTFAAVPLVEDAVAEVVVLSSLHAAAATNATTAIPSNILTDRFTE
jgi:hypothetical protein